MLFLLIQSQLSEEVYLVRFSLITISLVRDENSLMHRNEHEKPSVWVWVLNNSYTQSFWFGVMIGYCELLVEAGVLVLSWLSSLTIDAVGFCDFRLAETEKNFWNFVRNFLVLVPFLLYLMKELGLNTNPSKPNNKTWVIIIEPPSPNAIKANLE